MSEFDASAFGPDDLYLSGLIQLGVAIEVLELTDVDPEAVFCLTGLRSAYEILTPADNLDPAMNDLRIAIPGGTKKSIIISALLVERNQTLPEENRVAASGLLDVLGVER